MAVDRRGCMAAAAAVFGLYGPAPSSVPRAEAFVAGTDEEISGLVVLRAAEVCQFQEKLLRQVAACTKYRKDKAAGLAAKDATDQFGNSYC